MGANFLNIVVTLALQSPHPDSLPNSSPDPGVAFERISDLLQYNRVQGLSFGLGYQVPVPGVLGANIYATLRYGLSDERVTGRLAMVRLAPAGRLTLSAYHDIADLDPFSAGRTFSNTFNALFAGHDNGDYALAGGSAIRLERSVRRGMDLVLAGRVENLSSVSRVARSAVNDFLGGTGLFPPNPPVAEGTFGGASAQLRRVGRTRWSLTADVVAGSGQSTGRVFGDVLRSLGSGLGLTVRLKAGVATQPALPQAFFRLGGLNTIRGFEYGTLRAPAFWAGQLDITPFGGKVRPVAFLDAGQAARVSRLLSSTALVGGGIGLSLFRGLIRFDLSRPISPRGSDKIRIDLVIQGAR
jgi:hypothetical protein